MSDLGVACFHISPPNSNTAQTYWVLFELMAASLKRVAPKTKLHLLTNSYTNVPNSLSCDDIFINESAKDKEDYFKYLMFEELDCWYKYFEKGANLQNTVLVDIDILFQRDPGVLFDNKFDIGLTYNNDPSLHSFNAGVILVDSYRHCAIDKYFGNLLNQIKNYEMDQQQWYGDQKAMADVLGEYSYEKCYPNVFDKTYDKIRYRFWPVDIWNYSFPLDSKNKPIYSINREAGIIHFKGERKGFMTRYASEVLNIEVG